MYIKIKLPEKWHNIQNNTNYNNIELSILI